MVPGKRESRRIVGDHVLTQADLLGGGDFPDAVAIGGWPMDDHPPGGFDSTDASPGRQVATRDVYGIPLRSLYSRNVPNLLMAGRNISATHVAFTSTRVMGTCSAMGQAAGTAAALCVRHGLDPRDLAQDPARLAELRQVFCATIRRSRAFATRTRRSRPERGGDGLRRGCGTTAGNVIDGWLRDAPGDTVRELPEQDVPLELASSGEPTPPALHHWAGPMGPDGAWLELRWPQPVTVREIQITFDTGFQRELTLTSSDHINQGIIRGPQPETVRDYALLGFPPGGGAPFRLAEVRGNHQRVNRHRLAAVALAALRIHVTATNGAPSARVFEIRCYS
jgi:hypothetical protein